MNNVDLAPLFPNAQAVRNVSQDLLNLYVLQREFNRLHTHTGGSDGPLLNGTTAFSWPLLLPSGSVTAPTLAWASDPLGRSGFYRIGNDNFGLTIDGTKLLDFSAALLAVTGAVTISTTLQVTGLTTLVPQNALAFSHATAEIIPGATSLTFRNNADNASNIVIADAGGITFRAGLSGITSLAMGGALSGVTTLDLSGVLTSTNATDATSINTGSIITDGGVGIEKALWVGGLANIAGAVTLQSSLTFTLAESNIIGPATSIAFRNTANNATNMKILDGGEVDFRNNILFLAAAAKILPGTTSVTFRNNADSADNLSITDAGNVAIRGTLGVTGLLNALVPCCRVKHSAAQTISDATDTALAFDGEDFDTDTMHDTSTNNSRITCTTAGKYLFTAGVLFVATAGGRRQLMFRKNGTTILLHEIDGSSAARTGLTGSVIMDMAATDYMEVFVSQNSGAPVDTVRFDGQSPIFCATKVST